MAPYRLTAYMVIMDIGLMPDSAGEGPSVVVNVILHYSIFVELDM